MINQNHLISLSFGKSGDTEGKGIILGDNPAEHCFLLRDLIPMNFQISYNWESENVRCMQNFGNSCV